MDWSEALHSAFAQCPGPHLLGLGPSSCPQRSPLALHLSSLPFCKHTPLTFGKNSGIHPQYGFWLIIAFCLWRLHILLTLQSHDYLHSFYLPSESPPRSSNRLSPVSHNLFSLSFLFSYFHFFLFIWLIPSWLRPFLCATRDQSFSKAAVTDVIKIGIWYTRCPLGKCPWPELSIVP